ncbi:hypothetical protein PHMEG_00023192 [Phytophthora megakarya]|uniref:Secreted protein n=1 Tax=Phytophthora megakarya TaxID=4795 RepID=A0A225VIA3_9STRA|nr:hypothetical protein PHMEG_00023191 [Phytophthora megakarya]OWZ04835.1 hypothetical protein PHMEG_00023192 [Phytophthora megakarya]
MKILIVIAALAAVLMPAHGALRQCAGTRDRMYETSGFLTADWTQKACNASGGTIDPNKRGNQKCCNVPDSNNDKFTVSCAGQSDKNFNKYAPIPQGC